MKKLFTAKKGIMPEEYLKNMLDCIDENGRLTIARNENDETFYTAESEETATHIEEVKLDVKLANYDFLYAFYRDILLKIENEVIWGEYSPVIGIGKYGNRMVKYIREIDKFRMHRADFSESAIADKQEIRSVVECIDTVTGWLKCILIDCIVLYKTNAVGEMVEIKR